MPGGIKRKNREEQTAEQGEKTKGSDVREWTEKRRNAREVSISLSLTSVPEGDKVKQPEGDKVKQRAALKNVPHFLNIRYGSAPGKLAPQELGLVFFANLLRRVTKTDLEYVVRYGISDAIGEKLEKFGVPRLFLFECYNELRKDDKNYGNLACQFWAGM